MRRTGQQHNNHKRQRDEQRQRYQCQQERIARRRVCECARLLSLGLHYVIERVLGRYRRGRQVSRPVVGVEQRLVVGRTTERGRNGGQVRLLAQLVGQMSRRRRNAVAVDAGHLVETVQQLLLLLLLLLLADRRTRFRLIVSARWRLLLRSSLVANLFVVI